MSAPDSPRELAQRWHVEQSQRDPKHYEAYSSCWCCCTRCNPDWVSPGNPHWRAASDPSQ